MNREIKFRGKSVKTGEWVYGFYYEVPAPLKCIGKQDDPECNIVFENTNSCPDWGMPRDVVRDIVENETVGQYTGLKDKKGVEIYEGDILEEHTPSTSNYSVVKFGEIDISAFYYKSKMCTCFYHDFSNFNDNWGEVTLGNNLKNIEVIGNIYENPELLEVKNE